LDILSEKGNDVLNVIRRISIMVKRPSALLYGALVPIIVIAALTLVGAGRMADQFWSGLAVGSSFSLMLGVAVLIMLLVGRSTSHGDDEADRL
jgi:hypothetical protein